MRVQSTYVVMQALSWLLLGSVVVAQETAAPPDTVPPPPTVPPRGWILKSDAGLSLNQSTFNQAWAGDEVGTFSWIATFGASAERWLAPWAEWRNGFLLQFGQTHQQDVARDAWLAPLKSSDKITYRGIVLFKFWDFVDPFVAFDVDSQFYTKIGDTTRWLTPTLLTESVGVARQLVDTPRSRVLTRLGFAFKERIDRFGLFDPVTSDLDTRTTTEGGFEWVTQTRLAAPEDRTVFVSELRLFKAVETSEDDPVRREFWTAADVDWQNKLTNKVAKWFAFDLFWQILYDKQIDLRGQFKQTLGAGFTWQLI